jgi:hypothetical protein
MLNKNSAPQYSVKLNNSLKHLLLTSRLQMNLRFKISEDMTETLDNNEVLLKQHDTKGCFDGIHTT